MYNVLLDQSGKLIRTHTDQLIPILGPTPNQQLAENIGFNILLDLYSLPPVVEQRTSDRENEAEDDNEEENGRILVESDTEESADDQEETDESIITVSSESFFSPEEGSAQRLETPRRSRKSLVPVTPPVYGTGRPRHRDTLNTRAPRPVRLCDTISEVMEDMTQYEREDFLDEVYREHQEAANNNDPLQE